MGSTSPPPPLRRDLENFQNGVSTYFVVVDQGFLHVGRDQPGLWAAKVKCLSRHGFVIWTPENAYVNPTPRRRKEIRREYLLRFIRWSPWFPA